jgi:hypothetical protein
MDHITIIYRHHRGHQVFARAKGDLCEYVGRSIEEAIGSVVRGRVAVWGPFAINEIVREPETEKAALAE